MCLVDTWAPQDKIKRFFFLDLQMNIQVLLDFLRKRDIDGVKRLITRENVESEWYCGKNAIWVVCTFTRDDDASLAHYLGTTYPGSPFSGILRALAYYGRTKMIRELLDLGVVDEKPTLESPYAAVDIAVIWMKYESAFVLLDAGAKCGVNPPKWVIDFIDVRNAAREAAMVVLGLQRCGTLFVVSRDALRIVARCVWSTRGHQ